MKDPAAVPSKSTEVISNAHTLFVCLGLSVRMSVCVCVFMCVCVCGEKVTEWGKEFSQLLYPPGFLFIAALASMEMSLIPL